MPDFGEMADKAKDFAGDHDKQSDEALDKAADFADDKTDNTTDKSSDQLSDGRPSTRSRRDPRSHDAQIWQVSALAAGTRTGPVHPLQSRRFMLKLRPVSHHALNSGRFRGCYGQAGW